MTSLLWFRNDLRLHDNPALHGALRSGKILPVYILDARAGGASRWWLHHSLASLGADLAKLGGKLLLRRGDPAQIIPELAARIAADAVHAARAYEPAWRDADRAVDAALKPLGIGFHRHLSVSLFAPERITAKNGGAYGVFTPFAKACLEAGVPAGVLPVPEAIPAVEGASGEALEDWHLLPRKPDWAGGLRAEWQPGEAGAQHRLEAFLAGPIRDYAEARDRPDLPGTSKLSPHVHFGEISPRYVWHQAKAAGHDKGVETFLKELLWREFSLNLLWQHRDLRQQPIRAEFARFPWAEDQAALHAWQRGLTGIPIVDAGMRELWQTGWMHNRVRMICASFLVKHLLIPWQAGEAWFWDTLCEADEAANGASWQWVAGCGADAAPYFRVFNPVLQGRKFDPDGAYVRRFVPELARLASDAIHQPWECAATTLGDAGVALGEDYPHPLVNLNEGRARALAAFAKMRE